MMNVNYRWLNPDGVVTSRTIKQIAAPRLDERVYFIAHGFEQHHGLVKSVSWTVTETESTALVVLT